MGETIRARVRAGVLEPLEKLDLPEGKEVLVTIIGVPAQRNRDAFRRAFGRWKGTIDAEALIRNIYAGRLISTRSERAGPQAHHPPADRVPAAAQVDRSNPKAQPPCPRCEIAPIPTVFARARTLASRDPTGHSRGCLQKQSSPNIHKVQHNGSEHPRAALE